MKDASTEILDEESKQTIVKGIITNGVLEIEGQPGVKWQKEQVTYCCCLKRKPKFSN